MDRKFEFEIIVEIVLELKLKVGVRSLKRVDDGI